MEDSFFGFNTALDEDGLHDEPGQGLDEEEEEYDALNDETFGADAVECDWEQDHEKLAQIAEQSRVHSNSYNNGEDLDLEASVVHLVLEDGEEDDEVVLENGATSTPEKPFVSRDIPIDVHTSSYSSSAPSGFSLWSTSRHDSHPFSQLPPLHVHPSSLSGGKGVCTVEELERGLILQQSNNSSVPPGLTKPVLRLEDVERDLTASTTYPGLGVPIGRGQPQLQQQQDIVLLRNSQNAIASLGRGHFPTHLPAPPVLGIGRGSTSGTSFGQVVMPTRPVGLRGVPMPDLQQLQQQNHRLMASAPNLLRFLPPHVMVPQVPHGKGIGHNQGFPADNGMLRSVHHRCNNNMAFPPNFPHVEHRHGVQNPFSIRPDRPLGPHMNNMRSGNNFQSHLHRGAYHHHHHHRGMYNGSGDYDEYAGLMTSREKQWLLNIQLLQLSTDKPHVDDYYYTVFMSRQPKTEADCYQQERGHRERRDSYRDRDRDQPSRVYTPAQFENSLGKLQIGSVTAPRKIIDMDVVSPEGLDTTVATSQRDTRRAKQILLEIERLYLLLLQMEDLSNPMPEVRESVTEDKADLVQKVMSSLLSEDRLVSIMCIRKGKMLLLRLLPHLPVTENGPSYLLNLWSRILKGLMTIGRRDQGSDGLLPRFYPYFQRWVETLPFTSLYQLACSMVPLQPEGQDGSRTTSPVGRNVLVYALGNKFGLSVLASLLEHAEVLHPSLDEQQWQDWVRFMCNLVEAVGMVSSPDSLPLPIEPMDPSLLNRHLGRIDGLHIEKYALFEHAFSRHTSTPADKNNENTA
ncbi:protein PAT1 homolog 1 [Anabrus simplex]|uniref:protein PAT1 homolog 1 n=1 Tax=Anabrus simplex TaxID=316456 RepID=UPI0035A2C85D